MFVCDLFCGPVDVHLQNDSVAIAYQNGSGPVDVHLQNDSLAIANQNGSGPVDVPSSHTHPISIRTGTLRGCPRPFPKESAHSDEYSALEGVLADLPTTSFEKFIETFVQPVAVESRVANVGQPFEHVEQHMLLGQVQIVEIPCLGEEFVITIE